ncbi:MAG: NAD(+) synthase, partial [Rickettsiaceae bacterium]|nr:NAD(+) synthase [Rickettsiaceae bacterium]
MKICIAQINPILGDFEYNYQMILQYIQAASKEIENGFIIFPENSIGGYNPQDLILRKDFVRAHNVYLTKLAKEISSLSLTVILGSVREYEGKVYNSAFAICQGALVHLHDKIDLPNHGVFDEKRTFASGNKISIHNLSGKKICVIICQDIWNYGLCEEVIKLKPEFIFCINGSPFTKTKETRRIELATNLAKKSSSYVVYVNQVGLQDSLLYDGGSFVAAPKGAIIYKAPKFQESSDVIEIDNFSSNTINKVSITYTPNQENICSEIYNGLVFALREYLRKNNINQVIIGFSSGIDSTLTSVISFDAIGKENVHLYAMPTRFNGQETQEDAKNFCKINSVDLNQIDINELYNIFSDKISLTNSDSIALQNLQSRIRGAILMALSNQKKYLLLSTSNKSELAVGYATLYGDMNGGY